MWGSRGAAAVAIVWASLGSEDAAAQESGGQWGVGLRVGTMIIPGRYPALFPDRIGSYDFVEDGEFAGDPESNEPDRDLDPETGEPLHTSLQKVGPELRLAAESFYGFDSVNRLGIGAGGAFGSQYSDLWFTVGYGRVLYARNALNLVGGAETGFGSMRMTGTDEDETLRVPYFPIHATFGAELLNAGNQTYGLGLIFGTKVPSRHDYTDLEGQEQPVKSAVNFANYFFLGLEAKALFGKFRE
jgi:hypothetical protein